MILKTPNSMEQPQVIALKALAFLAGDEDRLSCFLASSGMDLQGLREQADDVNMLAGVLDHILANEKLLLEFAETLSRRPESIVRARQALPGDYHDA
jgi:Protein of unknown function (DUF3572)